MDQLLKLLKDKEKVIRFLLDITFDNDKVSKGLIKFQKSLDENKSEANMAKAIQTTMKILSKQTDTIRQLSLLMLIYTQSDSFDTDIAKILNKLGKGEEALKTIIEKKLGDINLNDLN